MLDVLSKSEAVAVLCLLMVSADDEIRLEELSSMLNNPFFQEHVTNKIGSHKRFLAKFNKAKASFGENALEQKALSVLKPAFPAFQTKMLALLTLIAGADDNYDQSEKELMARLSSELGIPMSSIEPELEKMKEAILNQSIQEKDKEDQDKKSSPNDDNKADEEQNS